MNLVTTFTNDILMRTLTNITTSIVSGHSLFVWFIDYKNSNYNIYKNELKVSDLHNKLLIVSALIKDIFQKYYKNVDFLEQKPLDQTLGQKTLGKGVKGKEDFEFIDLDKEHNLEHDLLSNDFSEIPKSIRLALLSTLDIITILNNEINKIHSKIHNHHQRWLSYIYSIKIQEEMDTILEHNQIFDKRLTLLFQILNTHL
jgi:hypothetical protein